LQLVGSYFKTALGTRYYWLGLRPTSSYETPPATCKWYDGTNTPTAVPSSLAQLQVGYPRFAFANSLRSAGGRRCCICSTIVAAPPSMHFGRLTTTIRGVPDAQNSGTYSH
jgi:hypothetical protein